MGAGRVTGMLPPPPGGAKLTTVHTTPKFYEVEDLKLPHEVTPEPQRHGGESGIRGPNRPRPGSKNPT